MRVHAFIDANIYLNFFAYPKADLGELAKIPKLVDEGVLTIYVTQQVKDEVLRNRAAKISETIAHFGDSNLSKRVPFVLEAFPESTEFKKACRAAEKNRDELIQKFKELAKKSELNADAVIQQLFDKGIHIPTTDHLYLEAVKRNRLGNPPGKKESFGDQLNWECLLHTVPKGTELSIVANDKDYKSLFEKTSINEFLRAEWRRERGADVKMFDDIGTFIQTVDKTIQIATEEKKNVKLIELIESGSFSSTHRAIAALQPYIPLMNNNDFLALGRAAVLNNQISWIKSDSDVENFFLATVGKNLNSLDDEIRQKFIDTYVERKKIAPDDDFEVPF